MVIVEGKMNIPNRKIISTIGLVYTLIATLACNLFSDQYDPGYSPGDYVQTGVYKINPETILASIDREDANVFTELAATPTADQRLSAGSFLWSQTDFLKISDALFQFVWEEGLAEWKLYQMDFIRDCQDDPLGFDSGTIAYYKEGDESYTMRDVQIVPLSSLVTWGETWSYPRSVRLKGIDLERAVVSADDVLSLAENNKGREARLAVRNECRILLSLVPDGEYDGWAIVYVDNNASHIFRMKVDPYTGKIE